MARWPVRVSDPDPVALTLEWLAAHLPEEVNLGDELHGDHRPYVAVRADGGSEQATWTSSASLGINVWASTEHQTQQLALEVRSWLLYMTTDDRITDVDCSLPMSVSDSAGGARRYMVVNMTALQTIHHTA